MSDIISQAGNVGVKHMQLPDGSYAEVIVAVNPDGTTISGGSGSV